jgi:thiamine biosynthesis lipoprotein ApbE
MVVMVEQQTRRDLHRRYAEDHGLAEDHWRALGTGAHLVVTEPARLAAAKVAVEDMLHRIDLAASRFRDDSELVALNRGAGRPVEVSPLLAQALRVALDAAVWTDGLVDPTVGAALEDFGYDRTFTLVAPDAPKVPLRVREVTGWHRVELDDEKRLVRMPAGTVLDLGATAKGLAADLAADLAAEAAGCGVLVSLGGDIAVAGDLPPGGWPVTVADTADQEVAVGAEPEQTILLRDGGLATSSVRARRWQRGGSEFHHLIDPRVGRPSTGIFRTVSVAGTTCTMANVASTAAVILGAEAPGWLEQRGLPARLVTVDGDVRCVAGWPEPERVSS